MAGSAVRVANPSRFKPRNVSVNMRCDTSSMLHQGSLIRLGHR